MLVVFIKNVQIDLFDLRQQGASTEVETSISVISKTRIFSSKNERRKNSTLNINLINC